MSFSFVKMHGLGNDFMVLENINQSISFDAAKIQALACRHTGIGFDQCLIVEKSSKRDIDFNYRIFNANGQEVGQCGNGARCLARFIQYTGLSQKKNIKVATNTTELELILHEDNSVSVNMGYPRLEPKDIPMQFETKAMSYSIPLNEQNNIEIHAINLGNPHAVIVVPNVDEADVAGLGKRICEHPLFPEQTNVGFMQIINPEQIRLRVYERGCAETRACGSGAAAAVAIGRLYHGLNQAVTVTLSGGQLQVYWPSTDKQLMLRGPAEFVYQGSTII